MKTRLLCLAVVFLSTVTVRAAELPLDAPWRKAVYQFTVQHLQHSAWGLAHSVRDYWSSLDIAAHDGLAVDEEVLFAAAMVYDMGGFDEFKKPGVDHAVRSAEICDTVLLPAGFPSAKLGAVKAAILAHTYYNPTPPSTPEGQALHDADTVDFLGMMGITRILSIVERDPAAPSLAAAVGLLKGFQVKLPTVVIGSYATKLAMERAAEMKSALDALDAESLHGKAL